MEHTRQLNISDDKFCVSSFYNESFLKFNPASRNKNEIYACMTRIRRRFTAKSLSSLVHSRIKSTRSEEYQMTLECYYSRLYIKVSGGVQLQLEWKYLWILLLQHRREFLEFASRSLHFRIHWKCKHIHYAEDGSNKIVERVLITYTHIGKVPRQGRERRKGVNE